MRIRLGIFSRFSLSPVARVSLGLVSLACCLLLTADLILGMLPDEAMIARQIRKNSSESLAVQLAALAQNEDTDGIRRTLHSVVSGNADVLSVAMRRATGEIAAETGNHERTWVQPADNKSTLTSVVVPINTSAGPWGQVEVSYRAIAPQTLAGWLRYPSIILTVTMLTGGLLVFYLYLRRTLQHLDPKAAIPERIRTAFDALSEAVLIVDKQGYVILANASFRALHPDAGKDHTGKRVDDVEWLVKAVGNHSSTWPWERAMRTKETVTGETYQIERKDDRPIKVTMNCAPVIDDKDGVRGCLITMDDLSLVEYMNAQLLDTVAQLELAKTQIEERSRELKHLADHDQLTNALTRRAFLQRAQQIFLQAVNQGAKMSCMMVDIDHFKSVNDGYGHLVGDQVIHRLALTLRENVGPQDLVCRYGGEEFCVLVRDEVEQARIIAEKLRTVVESTCGPAVIPGGKFQVTASFGVASLESGAGTLAEVIKQADQALYLAKSSGRNRVCTYAQVTAKQGMHAAA
jgi:diguanylate cyclase (GGDEF)-like protein